MINLEDIRTRVREYLADEKRKSYSIVGATFAVAILVLAFIIIPGFNGLSRTSRVVRDLSEKIELTDSRIKRLGEFEERLNKLRAQQKIYGRRIPAQKEIPRFLENLASVAKRSKVKIVSIVPYDVAKKEKKNRAKLYYGKLPILITAKSGYHQLGHFTSALEGGDRFITIKDMQLKSDNRYPRMHDVRMLLETYILGGDEKK